MVFWSNFWPNLAATFLGVIIAAWVAWKLNRMQQEKEADAEALRLFEDVPMIQAWIKHLRERALQLKEMPEGGRIGGTVKLAPFNAAPELIAAIRPVTLRACLITMAETATELNLALREHLSYSTGAGSHTPHAQTIADLWLEQIHSHAQWLLDRSVEAGSMIRAAQIGRLRYQSNAPLSPSDGSCSPLES